MIHIYDPHDLGFDPKRLERIDRLAERYIDAGKAAGMVSLVAREGQVCHFKAYGFADVATKRHMQRDDIFRIYSMTKPVTGAALMIALEEGWFNPIDPISKYVPAFADVKVYENGALVAPHRLPTIQDLYRHTAGLTYGGLFGSHPVSKMYADAGVGNSDETNIQFLDKIATMPLRYQPGTRFHYSMGMDVLAALIEIWSGQKFGRFLNDRIFEPLGMYDTGFRLDERKSERLTTLYKVSKDGKFKPADSLLSDYGPDLKFESGGGGLLSTPLDYFRFAKCLLNGGVLNGTRILGRKTVELMRSNALTPEQMPVTFEGSEPFAGFGYGVCVKVMQDPAAGGWQGSPGDFGWGGYAETYHVIDPVEKLVAINMLQLIPSMHYPIRKEFRMAVYQALV